MNKLKTQLKRLRIFLIILVFLIAGVVGWIVWSCYRVSKNMTEPVALIIEKGDSLGVIAKKIENAGMIKRAWVFELYAFVVGKQSKFQAGEYRLEAPFSVANLIYELTINPGKFQDRVIKVYEGWNNRNIAEALESQGWGSAKDFLALQTTLNEKLSARYDFLAERPKGFDMEGYLFPDTYRVSRQADFEQILIKMLDNFEAKLTPDLRADIVKSGHTLHEIVTMASVIEREVRSEEDRALVSGVFWNRIKIGMGLQSDATVNYVNSTRTTRPTLEELKTDSQYNTYKYKGLPPGPICSPSLSAIKAAIYPAETDYLYFLSAKDGRTIFSKTYQEHLNAKYKYLD